MTDRPDPPCPVSAAAARMRRSRVRRRRGMLPVSILVRRSEIGTLVRDGLLAPEAMNDKAAVRKALHAWLETGVLR